MKDPAPKASVRLVQMPLPPQLGSVLPSNHTANVVAMAGIALAVTTATAAALVKPRITLSLFMFVAISGGEHATRGGSLAGGMMLGAALFWFVAGLLGWLLIMKKIAKRNR